MTGGGGGGEQQGGGGGLAAPSDLIDFYRRWPEFREIAVVVAQHPDLSPAERDTVKWLIRLADRIGEHDINSTWTG